MRAVSPSNVKFYRQSYFEKHLREQSPYVFVLSANGSTKVSRAGRTGCFDDLKLSSKGNAAGYFQDRHYIPFYNIYDHEKIEHNA
jgi:hypothetical protein